MIFQFVIVHFQRDGLDVQTLLQERLRDALEGGLNEVQEDALPTMVGIVFQRDQTPDENGNARRLVGFSIELTEEVTSPVEVVDAFLEALRVDPVLHVVKCEDPLLRAELAQRAEELFAIEMKLRRALSVIYLHAYPDADPYDLLCDETMQPMSRDKPQPEQMKVAGENQFFHLTFGQYVGLNQRPPIKDLTAVARERDSYEAFRAELMRRPVEQEDDAGFLAALKERMDSIEKMRNAVAHNRRPPKKITNDYMTALPLVNAALDEYLSLLSAGPSNPP